MMEAQLRDIEARIEALSNLKPMFGVLKSIAGTARRSVSQRRQSASIYSDVIHKALNITLSRLGGQKVRFADVRTGPVGLVVISSDRGLCDVYNKWVIAESVKFIDSRQDRDVKLITMGRQGERHFQQRGCEIILSASVPLHGHLYYEEARRMATRIFELYENSKLSEVWVVHSLLNEHGAFETQVDQYMPPDLTGMQEDEEYPPWDPVSEIEPQEMVRYIVSEYLSITLYHYLLESMFAEQTMRYRAMDVASSHTEDLITALTAAAQQARQSEITTETLEVAAGAEATKEGASSPGIIPFDLMVIAQT
jgi:F-type H+-transporting ATPase subunit gamma